LASGSRGGMLQGLVLIVMILRDQRVASAARVLQAVVIVTCAVVGLLTLVPASLLQRTVSFEARSDVPGGESLQKRIRQLRSAGTLVVHHPVLGIGPGNYDWMSTATSGPGDTAHNSYVLALTEGGIVVF